MTKRKWYGTSSAAAYTAEELTIITRKSTFEKLSDFFKRCDSTEDVTVEGCCLRVPKNTLLFFAYFLFYVFFMITGALTFSSLETPYENQQVTKFETVREKFFQDYPEVNVARLEELLLALAATENRASLIASNSTGYNPNWSFSRSIFFSSTIVTTIGYGDMTPHTRTGKIFFLIFAMTGIPLTLVLISAFVERLLVPTTWLLRKVNCFMGHKPAFQVRIVHLGIVVFLLVALFMLIPAVVFSTLEKDWQFLDSFYYCFISLTTIGLGDYIPGDHSMHPSESLYKIVASVYLFAGITFMMLTLTVFYNVPQLNIGLFFKTCEEQTSILTASSTSTLNIFSQYQLDQAEFIKFNLDETSKSIIDASIEEQNSYKQMI